MNERLDNRNYFIYSSFEELLDKAEELGWKDLHIDGTSDYYNADVADSIEDECITYIEDRGIEPWSQE